MRDDPLVVANDRSEMKNQIISTMTCDQIEYCSRVEVVLRRSGVSLESIEEKSETNLIRLEELT